MEPKVESASVICSVGKDGQEKLSKWFKEGWVYVDGFQNASGELLVILERTEEGFDGYDAD